MTPPIDGGPSGDPDGRPESSGAHRPLPPELSPRRSPGRAAGGGTATAGTPPTRSAPRSRKRLLAWIAGGVAAVLLIGTVAGWATLDHMLGNIKKICVFCGDNNRPGGGVKGDLNILLVGSDSRSGLTAAQQRQLHVGHNAGQRSDTMILLHIPRGGGKAILVSLPRDSYVTIPRHKDATGHVVPASMNKLNASYSIGGAQLLVRTVEATTHVRIDHYVEINFLGFVKMVDALGGVTICNPSAINDPVHFDPASNSHPGTGLKLPKGKVKIDGVTALKYVRAREFDPSADLGRIQRQQRFMAAMVQRAKSTGVLLNPVRLLKFLGAVTGSLTTDKDFGTKQIKDLALNLRSMSPAHVEMIRMPLKPGSFNTSVGNVVQWDPLLSRQLFRDLTFDRPVGSAEQGKTRKVTIPPSSISMPVLNATNQNGFAAKVAGDLGALGFHVSRTGNAPSGSDPAVTVVRYGPSRADSAKTLAAAIPGAKLQEVGSLGSSLQVIVGSNYHGVQRVVVASPGQTGTLKQPRTAAQDLCS